MFHDLLLLIVFVVSTVVQRSTEDKLYSQLLGTQNDMATIRDRKLGIKSKDEDEETETKNILFRESLLNALGRMSEHKIGMNF